MPHSFLLIFYHFSFCVNGTIVINNEKWQEKLSTLILGFIIKICNLSLHTQTLESSPVFERRRRRDKTLKT
jgi:hypothetical protein